MIVTMSESAEIYMCINPKAHLMLVLTAPELLRLIGPALENGNGSEKVIPPGVLWCILEASEKKLSIVLNGK